MNVKKLIALGIISLPVLTHAMDIKVFNDTDSYGTGKINYSPCSSDFGGVANPHQSLVLPNDVIWLYCLVGDCIATVYTNNSCSGASIATVKIDRNNGVIGIDNLDSSHYRVTGSGGNITMTQVKQGWLRNALDWIKSL